MAKNDSDSTWVAWVLMIGIGIYWYQSSSETEASEAYDRGYSDGFAAGYNTACEIRSTIISGDWEIESYSEGYAYGHDAGIRQCNLDRANKAEI